MAKSDIYCSVIDKKMQEAIMAIADSNRLKILYFLGEHGRMCVGDIAGQFHISRPAVSHHLKVLKNCGLVDYEKVGQEVYYSVKIDDIVFMLRTLADTLETCCSSK